MSRVVPPKPLPERARAAFTIVELLVVVAVIGLLTALALPAIQGARSAARRAACLNNLRAMGQALHAYAAAHDNLLPYADRPVNIPLDMHEPVRTLAAMLDLPAPAAVNGIVTTPDVFVCPQTREIAQDCGWSYDYTPVDLFSTWIDGPPQAGVSRYLARDPSVVVIMDSSKPHAAPSLASGFIGRNVLTIGGSVEPGGPQHRFSPSRPRP